MNPSRKVADRKAAILKILGSAGREWWTVNDIWRALPATFWNTSNHAVRSDVYALEATGSINRGADAYGSRRVAFRIHRTVEDASDREPAILIEPLGGSAK